MRKKSIHSLKGALKLKQTLTKSELDVLVVFVFALKPKRDFWIFPSLERKLARPTKQKSNFTRVISGGTCLLSVYQKKKKKKLLFFLL